MRTAPLRDTRAHWTTLTWPRPTVLSRSSAAALVTALALGGVFFLVRVPTTLSPALSETYYDEALTGLMSLEILRGVPQVFYWGQPYLGAVDAYLAAAAFEVAGSSTLALRLGTAWVSVLWVWAAWRIGRRLAGEEWGMFAGLQLALPPIFLTHMQLSSHAEGVAFALAAVALAAATSLVQPRSSRSEAWAWTLLGLAAGLAWWTTQMTAMLLGAAALGLLVARPGVLWQPGPYAALGLFGLASAPFWLWNAQHEWATFRHLLAWGEPLPGLPVRAANIASALVAALRDTYWDARAVPLPPWASWLGWIVLVTVYLPAVGLALVRTAVWGRRLAARTRPWCDPLDLVVLAFWLTLAAQLLTWFGVSGVIRYSLTFLGPLPLLVTAALGRLAGTGRAGRAAAIALAGALLAFNLAGHVAFIRAGAAAPRRPVDAAIGRMQALGLTACYADSRISQVLSFESAGRIRCADYGGLRDYASLQAVDRVEEPGSVAIVTHRVLRNPEPGEMARALARIGAAFERTAVGDYVIFHRFVLPRPPARPVPSAGWRARASARPEAAALAFDRRDWTRWAVPNRAGEWFELDLGRVHAVTQVTLAAAPWPADTPSGLRVEVSADGIHWETAASDSGLLPGLHWWKGHPRMDDGGRIILRFSPRRGRYLRLTSVGTPRPGASWGLSELFVGEAAPAPWSPPAAAISALAAAARELDRWMDDPTGSHPARSPVTMEHRRNQVPWARALAEANTALAAAPEWDEPHHLYGLALARFGWSDGSERALDRAQRQGASLEVVRLAELIDSQPDAAWRAGRLSAWAEALERLGRPTDAAAIRARPEPVPARPVYVRFGPNLELVGVDGPAEARAGETVRLSYHWRLRGAAPHDPWVFLHVLGWDGARNHDQPVGQIEFGPSRWVAGDRVRQTLAFTVPPGTAPGAYSLRAGVWLPSTGRRLRILASDLPQTRHAVDLGTLVVVP